MLIHTSLILHKRTYVKRYLSLMQCNILHCVKKWLQYKKKRLWSDERNTAQKYKYMADLWIQAPLCTDHVQHLARVLILKFHSETISLPLSCKRDKKMDYVSCLKCAFNSLPLIITIEN